MGGTSFETCDWRGDFETRGEEVREGGLREEQQTEKEGGDEDEGQVVRAGWRGGRCHGGTAGNPPVVGVNVERSWMDVLSDPVVRGNADHERTPRERRNPLMPRYRQSTTHDMK